MGRKGEEKMGNDVRREEREKQRGHVFFFPTVGALEESWAKDGTHLTHFDCLEREEKGY